MAADALAASRSSPAAAACWACGAEPVEASRRLAPLPFFACPACGFVQRDAPGATASQHYVDDDYGRDRATDFLGADFADRRHDARVRIGFLRRHAPGGALLDVGTAGGAFLVEAAAAGYTPAGIEPTPSFAAYARGLGLDVQTATLEDADLPDRGLDVVTMWHVLEHLEAPVERLRRIHGALRPGGVLAVEVPNAGSAMAEGMGREWPMLEPEVHVGQFNPIALGRLIERSGFAVRRMETVSNLAYLPARERLTPGALAHRIKWRRGTKELLRAAAVAI